MKEYGKKKWSDSSSEVAHESTIPRDIAPFPDEMNTFNEQFPKEKKLDPVGPTVRYEMMKLCTGSV